MPFHLSPNQPLQRKFFAETFFFNVFLLVYKVLDLAVFLKVPCGGQTGFSACQPL